MTVAVVAADAEVKFKVTVDPGVEFEVTTDPELDVEVEVGVYPENEGGYSQTSLIRTPNIQAPPSTGQLSTNLVVFN